MKVKAYKQIIVCEEIEIPDECFEIDDSCCWFSKYQLKEEYIDEYLDEDLYIEIDDLDGKLIAMR